MMRETDSENSATDTMSGHVDSLVWLVISDKLLLSETLLVACLSSVVINTLSCASNTLRVRIVRARIR